MTETNAPETTQEAVEGEAQEATTTGTPDSQVDAADVQVTAEDSNGTSEAQREREARKKANREAQNLRDRLKKYQDEEEARKQAAMSDLEKANTRAEKLERERNEAIELANTSRAELRSLRVRQEATSKALASGAKQERLEGVLRLTDLADATDEDGNPDPKAIEAAIKATLKAYPEFRAGARDVGGPSNPSSEPPSTKKDPWNMTSEEFADLQRRVSNGERVVPT